MKLYIIIFFIFFILFFTETISANNNTENQIIADNDIDLKDFGQSIGAFIAIILVFLKLWEFNKKRVILKIKLKQNHFSSNHYNSDGKSYDDTQIGINVDLRNTGLEPTTLVGVDFHSDHELLNNLVMANRVYNITEMFYSFDEIRIEPNDRKVFDLFIHKNVLINNKKELNAAINFKTTQNDIKKKIQLNID